jgi:hypothetical protein
LIFRPQKGRSSLFLVILVLQKPLSSPFLPTLLFRRLAFYFLSMFSKLGAHPSKEGLGNPLGKLLNLLGKAW